MLSTGTSPTHARPSPKLDGLLAEGRLGQVSPAGVMVPGRMTPRDSCSNFLIGTRIEAVDVDEEIRPVGLRHPGNPAHDRPAGATLDRLSDADREVDLQVPRRDVIWRDAEPRPVDASTGVQEDRVAPDGIGGSSWLCCAWLRPGRVLE